MGDCGCLPWVSLLLLELLLHTAVYWGGKLCHFPCKSHFLRPLLHFCQLLKEEKMTPKPTLYSHWSVESSRCKSHHKLIQLHYFQWNYAHVHKIQIQLLSKNIGTTTFWLCLFNGFCCKLLLPTQTLLQPKAPYWTGAHSYTLNQNSDSKCKSINTNAGTDSSLRFGKIWFSSPVFRTITHF